MTLLIKLLSVVGLLLTVIPSVLVMLGKLTWETHSHLMLAGMVMWFSTAPFWMKKGA